MTKIPAKKELTTRIAPGKKLKVAAYCRVSTDDKDQLNSYRVQKEYYTKFISNNEQWSFAGIYADEGITGTMVTKRDDFLRMIRDCEKGKIDMILIKSVSRYARNIVDSISYVRKLKAMGIAIFFEEQNINSLKENSEIYLGIHSVMAQSESENISANVKWGIAKRMENGTYCGNMNMFGYRWNKETKEVTVVPEEAEAVKLIFQSYLDGLSAQQIKALLEEKHIKTYSGNDVWEKRVITSILTNEKYCGDVMYQKTYSEDCLTKKKKVNHGEKDRYLIRDKHEPIISRDMFYSVQAEIAHRNAVRSASDNSVTQKGRYSAKHILSELLICDDCGSRYRRKYHKSLDGVKYYWRCLNRLENGKNSCGNSTGLEEEALKAAICRAISGVLEKRENGYALIRSHLIYAKSGDTKSEDLYIIDRAIDDEETRIEELTELAIKSENNQDKYMEAIADCNKRIAVLREKKEGVTQQLRYNTAAKNEIDRIQQYLNENRAVVHTFDDATIHRMVNGIRVTKDLDLIIYIKGGIEIVEHYDPKLKSA